MKIQKIVAAVAAASLAFGSAGSFGQSYIAKDQQDQAVRAKAAREYAAQQQAAPGADRQGSGRPENRGVRANEQHRDTRDRNGYRGNSDYRGNRDYRGNGGHGDYRGNGYRGNGYRGEGRGAGPDHSFYRGGRLPYEYRNRQYVVDDWRGHRLSAPPRGYHWVQTGSDYVLVAIATGIIASILLSQ